MLFGILSITTIHHYLFSTTLYLSWLRRRKFTFTLPPRFSYLEPGDVVATPFHDQIEKVQISKINFGANRLLECEAFLYDAAVISTTQTVTPDQPPDDPVTVLGLTELKILDIPLIVDSDVDNGLYAVANQPSSLFVSRNGGTSYDYATDLELPSTYGICNGILGNWPNGSLLDISNTIGVTLETGELESVSITDLENGQNTALIGSEIIRFQTATLTGTKTYTLSNLFRGRRGTESFIATHTSNESFTLLSDYIERIKGEVTDIGKTLYFKALTGDQDLSQVTPVTLTVIGNSIKPYSPVNLSGSQDAAGNISINWTRRDRKAGDRIDYQNFPLSEVGEKYEIEILNGAAVVRTLTATSPNIIYTSSEQTTDFAALQTSITFRVYQISGVFGRGTVRSATINLSLVPSIPTITGFSPTQGSIGQSITVYGSGFVGATQLAINGTACTGVSIISDSEITGVIAAGTTSGKITVTTPGGTGTSATAFAVVVPSGDMLKTVYDANNNGIVDLAENGIPSGGTVGQYLKKTGALDFQASWVDLGGSNPRERLTSDRTYYVATTGSDTNDGLSSTTPFATWQKAMDFVSQTLDLGIYDCKIKGSDGTYNQQIVLKKYLSSGGVIIFEGNPSNPANCVLDATSQSSIAAFLAPNSTGNNFSVVGFTIVNNKANGCAFLLADGSFTVLVAKAIRFGVVQLAHFFVEASNIFRISDNYEILYTNSIFHGIAYDSGFIRLESTNPSNTITINGNPNFSGAFISVERGSKALLVNQNYNGSATGKQYSVAELSLLYKVGGSANLPGNLPGTVDSSRFGVYRAV